MTILGPKKGISSLAAADFNVGWCYKMEFRSTHQHFNVDALSRIPLDVKDSNVGSEAILIENLLIRATQIQRATRRDLIFSQVLHFTWNGWPEHVFGPLKTFYAKQHEISVKKDCLLWGICVNPKCLCLQNLILGELHKDHPGSSWIKFLACSRLWWPGLDLGLEKLAKSCTACLSVIQVPAVAPFLHGCGHPNPGKVST